MDSGRRAVSTFIKIFLVGGLLYLLAQKGFLSLEATGRAFTQYQYVIPGLLGLFFVTFMVVIRWQWLLRAQGIHLTFKRALQLAFVGNFFNIALPGAVSGDFVKAFYIAKEVGGQRSRAFGSILFDRLAGVSALVLTSVSALVAGIDRYTGTSLTAAIQIVLSLGGLGVVGFYAYLFLLREEHDPLLRFFQWASGKKPWMGSFLRIYEGIRHYHNHRRVVAKALAISMVVHITVCLCCVAFAKALGVANVPVLAVFVVVPLGLLVTAVPIFPAGIGTGHAAFAWLFSLLGIDRGADIFTLFAFGQLCIGAVGGVVYLRFKAQDATPLDRHAPST